MSLRYFAGVFAALLFVAGCSNEPEETAPAADESAPESTASATFNEFSNGDIDVAKRLRDDAMVGTNAYALLESLTTEVGPRLAGSEANQRAVEWAMVKFAELGFDRVWREPVTLPGWRRVSANARVLTPFPQPLRITSLGLSGSTPEGGVDAEIIHFDTIDDLISAPEGAAEGKIVFISNRMERARDGSGYGPAVRARGNGPAEAFAKGAVALVIRSIGTDSKRLPHTGSMRTNEPRPRVPAAALSNPDADLLVNMLSRGLPVTMHLDIQNEDLGEVTTSNIIGDITGSEAPDEIVLIGAHLDSWDLGTGAIDDGAGVAITLSAGARIAALAQHPRRTVRVVMFGAEEVGLYGARAYAVAHAEELSNHIIAAESDFGAGRIYRLSPAVGEAALPAMAEIAQVMAPLGIELGANDGDGGPDITPMFDAGVPAAGLDQDGTVYFDLHHTADDTLDKVDADALDQNVAAYVTFAYLAAQYDGRFTRDTEAEEEPIAAPEASPEEPSDDADTASDGEQEQG